MSQHTFCAKYDLDFDEEQLTIKDEPELKIQEPQQPQDPNNPKTMSGEVNKELGKA